MYFLYYKAISINMIALMIKIQIYKISYIKILYKIKNKTKNFKFNS